MNRSLERLCLTLLVIPFIFLCDLDLYGQAGPSQWFDCDLQSTTQCMGSVPSLFVDLRNSPSQKWYSCKLGRGDKDSTCCGIMIGNNDQCIEFKVMVHPQTEAIILEIPQASESEWQDDRNNYSGPNPVPSSPGAKPSINTYRINCGSLQGGANGDDPACLTSSILNDTIFITFCQTGNNDNVYRIKTLRAEINPDVTILAEGCGETLTVSAEDIDVSSVTWNSLQNPAYNAYLSSTTGDTTVTVVVPKGAPLPPGSPPILRYEVCASPIAASFPGCGSLSDVCAEVQVAVVSPPSATVSAPTVCPGDPYYAEVTGQGSAVLNYTFFDGPDGTGSSYPRGMNDNYTFSTPGNKSVVIVDPSIVALGFDECAYDTVNFTISTFPVPPANISGPPLICINTSYGFSTPNVPGATYDWEFREYPANSLISTSSSRTPNVSFSNCGDKLAILTVTSSDGCDSTTMRVFQADSLPPDLTGCNLPEPTVECGGTAANNTNITNWHNNNLSILQALAGCVTDDCPWTVTSNFNLGDFTPDPGCGGGTTAGSITVTYTVSDGCQQSTIDATYTIEDTAPPTVNDPILNDMSFECVASIPAPDTNFIVNDVCGSVSRLWLGDSPAGDPCNLTITRTYRVTDACGNVTDFVQTFTINDLTPPSITCPPNRFLEACGTDTLANHPLAGNLPYSTTNNAITLLQLQNAGGNASDNCGIDEIYYSDSQSGSCPIVVTRTFVVVDTCGNMNSCVQQLQIDDTTDPTITCPGPVTIEGCDVSILASSSQVENLAYSETPVTISLTVLNALGGDASDNCTISSITYSDTQTGTCPIVITRTFVVEDGCGNTQSCTQTIQVDDTTPPSLICPGLEQIEACGVWDLATSGQVGNLAYSTTNASLTVAQFTGVGGTATDACGIEEMYYRDSQTGSCPIVITRTFFAVDTCGNLSSCTQTIEIDDDTDPILTCPPNRNLEACGVWDLSTFAILGNLAYSATIQSITTTQLSNAGGSASDNCGIDSLYYFDSQTGSCPITITRTYVVVDSCNNRVQCAQTITIDDTTLPTITCPASITLEACYASDLSSIPAVGNLEYSEDPRLINVSDIVGLGGNASDNCGIDSLYYFDSQTGICPIVLTRTFIVVDSCGNTASCVQVVSINDTTDPVLVCPPDANIEACGIVDLASAPEVDNLEYSEAIRPITVADIQGIGGNASDNCAIDSLYYRDSQAGSCPVVVTRTFTLVDSCGNRVSCSQQITINDTTDPLITCPSDEVIEACGVWDLATSAQAGNLAYSTSIQEITLATLQGIGGDASDNCAIDSIYYFDSQTGFCPIIVTRTFVVVDTCGNSAQCTQELQINDTTDPVISCPGPEVIEACGVWDLASSTQVGGLEYSEDFRLILLSDLTGLGGNASDNCGIDSLYYFDSQTGSCPIVITRTFVVVDSCGNSVDCTQEIQIDDTTFPAITCPVDEVIEACGVWDLATSPQVGNLEYSEEVRTILLSELTGLGGTASDNCGIDSLYYYDSQSGFCPIVITRTYAVVDSCGNRTECTQQIRINDTTDPLLTCPADDVIEACYPSDLALSSQVGNLEYSESIRLITIAEIQGAGGDASDNCGLDSLYYYDSQAGFCPIIITRVFVAVDSCGNRVQCTQEIQINDTTDPLLVCPADEVIEGCDESILSSSPQVGNLEYSESIRPIMVSDIQGVGGDASDNCAIDSLYYFDQQTGFCPIVITRTFVVVDSCGNRVSCTQEIQIIDTTLPTITCPADVSIEACGVWDLATAPEVNNLEYSESVRFISVGDMTPLGGTAADNCGIDSLYYFDSQTGACPIVITRTYVVVDSCGNRVDCTQEIQIDDTTLPTITCPGPQVIEACGVYDLATSSQVGNLEYSEVPRIITLADIQGLGGDASDNCGIDSLYYYDSQTGSCPIIITRTFVVIDSCGNQVDCPQEIQIDDTTLPSITCPVDEVIEACGVWDLATSAQVGNLEYSEAIRTLTLAELQLIGGDASDNCGIDSLYYYDSQTGACPIVITRTFVVVDSCGNRLDCPQEIQINDTTDPLLTCPADDILEGCSVADLATSAQVGNLEYSEGIRIIDISDLQGIGGDASDNCGIDSLFYYDSQTGACPIIVTRTYVAIDSCGNRVECMQEIQINDTTLPLLTCPADEVIEGCDISILASSAQVGNLEYSELIRPITVADLQGVGGDASDNCFIDSLYYIDFQTGSCPTVITRTFVVVDSCGNRVECPQEIQINDTTLPTITCPADVVIEACGVWDLGTAPQVNNLEYSEAVRFVTVSELAPIGGAAADNCGIDSLYYYDQQTGSCPIVITRTFVVVDTCGNRVDCTQEIQINDTTSPTLTCPGPQVIEACGVYDLATSAQVGNLEYSESPRIITVGQIQGIGGDAADNCGIDSLYYYDSQTGSCPIIITRTFVVQDSCGNLVQCTQEIQINDTTLPTLICPGPEVIEACGVWDLATSPEVGNLEYSESIRDLTLGELQAIGGNAGDNCGIDSLYYFDIQTGSCPIIITRTFVVVDSCGNRLDCQQEIQINDTTDPILTCPSDQVLEGCSVDHLATAPEVGNLEFSPGIREIDITELQGIGGDASDNCGIDSLFYYDSQAGSCPIIVTRTFVVIDSCGNRVECTQEIQINDTTLPLLICPVDEVIEGCDVSILATSSQVGNLEFSSAVRLITIGELQGIGGDASDNCFIDSLYYFDSQTGSCPTVITRTFVVVDSCGNRVECPQEIQINDTTLPTITCPADVTLEACGVWDLASAPEVNNLEYSEDVRFITVADITPIGGTAADNCGIDSLYYFDQQTGSCPVVITRTYVVVDTCGNRADCAQDIQINDTTDPTLTCPGPVVIEACGVSDLATAPEVDNLEYSQSPRVISVADIQGLGGDASDNCGIDSLYYYDVQTGFCPIVVTRTFVVQDSCGNQLQCTQEIRINDTTLPTISCPVNVTLEACTVDDLATAPQVNNLEYSESFRFIDVADLVGLGGSAGDNCGIDSLYYYDTQTDTCPIIVSRTFVVVDSCGNRADCTQEILIDDTTIPSIVCPQNVIGEGCDINDVNSISGLPFADVVAVITTQEFNDLDGLSSVNDACGIREVNYIDVIVQASCPLIIERTFTAIDLCGNTNTCVQTITVEDTQDPVIICPDEVVGEGCDLTAIATLTGLDFTTTPVIITEAQFESLDGVSDVSDNCGVAEITYVDAIDQESCPIIVTRTFTVLDSCDLIATCTQQITVEDIEEPLITCPANIVADGCTTDELLTITGLEFSGVETSIEPALFIALDGQSNTSDNCGVREVRYRDVVLSPNCPIRIERTFTAYDTCGLTASCVQLLELNPIPIIDPQCPAPLTVDACLTQAEVDALFAAWIAEFQYLGDGCNLRITSLDTVTAPDACGGTRNIQFVVQDLCGNITSCNSSFTVPTAPELVMTCPTAISVQCESDVPAAFSSIADFENGGGSFSNTCGLIPSSFRLIREETDDNSCPEIRIRTYEVRDVCGHTRTCTQQITINDTIPPELVGVPEDVEVVCTFVPFAPQLGSELYATDNCGTPELVFDEEIVPGFCENVYGVVRTWTATDACGNQTVAVQNITVLYCRPDVDIFLNPNPVCLNGDVVLDAVIVDNYQNPVYRWQREWNGNWVDVPGGNTVPFTLVDADTDDAGLYRLVIADNLQNLFDDDCNVISEPVRLQVIEPVVTDLEAEICDGEDFIVGSESFDEAGNYQVVLTAANGCDSIVNLDLIILEHTEFVLDTFICEGERLVVGNRTMTSTGTYTALLSNAAGCDSLVTINLVVHEPTITQINETICEGETLTVGSETYDETGNYSQVLIDQYGCDSIINVSLIVNPIQYTVLNEEICIGQRYRIAGQSISAPGTYTFDLTSAITGCDSIVTLNLVVNDEINTVLNQQICIGDSYLFGGESYSDPGTYIDTLIASAGCDSIVTLNLEVVDAFLTEIVEVLCEGESITVAGTTYTESGYFEHTLVSSAGCDSMVTLDLTVNPVYDTTIVASICQGIFFEAGGQTFNATGIYNLNLQTQTGCDSLITLDLTVNPNYDTTYVVTLCDGDVFTLGGETYDETGVYVRSFSSSAGCDSTIIIDLTVNPVYELNLNRQICAGGSVSVGSSVYNATGSYSDTLLTSAGCDSIVHLLLTVVDVIEDSLQVQICEGDSYVFAGTAYTSSGTYVETFVSAQGCDSVVTLQLEVLQELRDTLVEEICQGTVYNFDGTNYNSTGIYEKTYLSSAGCDSIVTLELTVIPTVRTTLSETICEGESYNLGGTSYSTAGTFRDTLSSAAGCDSIVTLNLSISSSAVTNLRRQICEGETITFNGRTLDSTGVYTDSLLTTSGCDSIVTMNLTVNPVYDVEISGQICEGQNYNFNGQVLTASGVYTADLVSRSGCDSIVTLTLDVVDVLETLLIDTICQGESYDFFGQMISVTGSYNQSLTSTAGCDSIVTLQLTVLGTQRTNSNVIICQGDTLDFGGRLLTSSGIYTDTLLSEAGCDSIVSLDLTVLPNKQTSLIEAICAGEVFDFNGRMLDSTGIYTDSLSTRGGCDSIVTLTLTVHPVYDLTRQAQICEGQTYRFDGNDLTETGSYTATFNSISGCDSIVTIELEVLDILVTNLTDTICEGSSVSFFGRNLSSTGTYSESLTSVAGCDSVVSLQLTVLPTQRTSLQEEICEGDTLFFRNQSLTTTGIYVDTFATVHGCDSIVTLDLTVNPVFETPLQAAICADEIYDFNGRQLDSTGIYFDTLSSAAGCDSVVILDLTVHPLKFDTIDVQICLGQSYQFGGNTYNATGTYEAVFTSAEGCDSSVVLNLQVLEQLLETVRVQICEGDSYSFNGSTYSAPGSYDATLVSSLGCDSVVTLELEVLGTLREEQDISICQGEFVLFGTDTLWNTGTYIDTFTSVIGCDSISQINLTVFDHTYDTTTVEICAGEIYDFRGKTYDSTGIFIDTALTSEGCNAYHILDLVVLDLITDTLSVTICPGDRYDFDGQSLTASGTYTATFTAANGCDSLTVLDLLVLDPIEEDLTIQICFGQTYTFDGQVLTDAGDYQAVFTSALGCDSLVRLNLQVVETIINDIDAFICEGDSVTINGTTYGAEGTYRDTLTSAGGCDSVLVITVASASIKYTTLEELICDGEIFEFGGQEYTSTTVVTDTLVSAEGCDSIVTLELIVLETYEEEKYIQICTGSTYRYAGQDYTEAGTYEVMLTSLSGCDSIVYLNLSIVDSIVVEMNVQICTGNSYFFAGETLVTSGTYRDIGLSALGCDSTTILNLEVLDELNTMEVFTICEGESVTIDDSTYTSSTVFRDTVVSVQGCDSIITYEVIVLPGLSLLGSDVTICEGESIELRVEVSGSADANLTWTPEEGLSCTDCPNPTVAPTETTTYTVSALGCKDSLVETTITVEVSPLPILELTEDQTIILGQSITLSATILNEGDFSIDWFNQNEGKIICSDCPSVNQQPSVETTYRAWAYSDAGCEAEGEVTIFVGEDPCRIGGIKAANAFTPNSDGFNDYFEIQNTNDADITLIQVFNRWGEIMFEAQSEEALWDGTFRGVDLNPGVYMYIIHVDCAELEDAVLVGNVTLIR